MKSLWIWRGLSIGGAFLLCGNAAVFGQSNELKDLSNQFKTEAGCPVAMASAKTQLEIDPFGTPIACRIYLDYKNTSAKTISGVKFRIGYVDNEEKVRGTFHAPDGHMLAPGALAAAKWRGERVDPRTSYVLIRVLLARFSDGTVWESSKIKGLAAGTGGSAGQEEAESQADLSGGESPAGGKNETEKQSSAQNGSAAADKNKTGSASDLKSQSADEFGGEQGSSEQSGTQSPSSAATPSAAPASSDGY